MECYKCLAVRKTILRLEPALQNCHFFSLLAFCNLTNCCILHLTILLRFYTFFFCSLKHWKFSHYLINFFVAYKKVRCDKISTNSGLEKNSQSSVFVPKLSWAKIILTGQKNGNWEFLVHSVLIQNWVWSMEFSWQILVRFFMRVKQAWNGVEIGIR